MPFSNKLSHEERAEEILRAAAKCFCDKGFHQTSMNDISRAAGISTGLIYHYFESKNAIIQVMAEEHKQELRDRLEEARAANSLEEAVCTLFSGECENLLPEEHSALAVDLYGEARRNAHIAGLIREIDEYVCSELVNLIREFQVHQPPAGVISAEEGARMLLTFHHGHLMEQMRTAGSPETTPEESNQNQQIHQARLQQLCTLLFRGSAETKPCQTAT